MRLSLIYILFIFGIFLSCSKKDTTKPEVLTIEDILIKNNELSGWQRVGSHWVANSEAELYQEINGEAVVYANYGFVEATEQEYQGKVLDKTEVVRLRIFNQGKSANAKSVFDEVVRQMASPTDWPSGAGQEARIERFSLSQRIIYRKSKYFVAIDISAGSNEALDVLKTFANNVDGKIP